MKASRSSVLSGLYIILDPSVCPSRSLIEVLKTAAEAGAVLFQYRNKTASMKDAYVEALALRQAAAKAGVLFIVNDRCDLALAIDADGVHLGQGDLPLDLARKVMGPEKLIGISTHSPTQVRDATAGKPDYLGFGPIFTPGSKQDHDPLVGLEGYARYARSHRCPSLRSAAFRSTRWGKWCELAQTASRLSQQSSRRPISVTP
jgi:thiamine-phosphate pyrophosphorylase